MKTAAEILQKHDLHPLSAAPGRYYTPCPKCSAHRSRTHQRSPCLGITIDDQGVHFGCSHCGWKGGEYFNGKANGKNQSPFVAVYDYVDETGALLFQVCRKPDKTFPQRKTDGKGGWTWKTGDIRKVLYRLPEVIEALASGHAVLVVEGEKDVENLRKIGVAATCNPGGAAGPNQKPKWRPEFSEALRGADVIVVPDNDEPGRAHAEAIAQMSAGIAARVRILELAKHWPECPRGGDISDWLLGHNREQLDALIEHAPDYSDEPKIEKTNGSLLIVSTAEFVTGFTPPDYLIDGLIQRRFLYSMTAPTGTGKTAIALRMAAHIDLGLPLAGRDVDQGKVLFLAGENPDDVRMRWIKLLEEMQIEPETSRVFWRAGSFSLSDQELRKRIDVETTRHGPFASVIVDTSAAFFGGDDENSNSQLGAHARMLRSLVELPGGPTVIVTCHPTKNANNDNLLPRGGGAFIAEVDGNLVCVKQPDSQIVELHWHGKFRGPDFAPIPFALAVGKSPKLVDSKGRAISTITARPISQIEAAEADVAARIRQDKLLEVLEREPGASLADIAKALGWFYLNGDPNKSLVNRTLKALEAARLIKREARQWVITKAGTKAAQARFSGETINAENEARH